MAEQEQGTGIRVEALSAPFQAQAQDWAQRLGLPQEDDSAQFAVQIGADGLQIQQLGPQAPVRCGWISSKGRRRIDACSAAAMGR